MSDYLYHHNANTHWSYPTSEETDRDLESARQTCADFLNASSNEIAFGANMTTSHLPSRENPGADVWPGRSDSGN